MAGTVATVHHSAGSIRTLVFSIVADAGDGSIPDTTLPSMIEGRLLALETVPGSPAPTNNFDVSLLDEAGLDLLETVGVNRSNAAPVEVPIVFSGTNCHAFIDETNVAALRVSGNSVASAALTVRLKYALGV